MSDHFHGSSNGNDLPREHGVSDRLPSSRRAISTQHQKQKGQGLKYFPLPPLSARTFSFFTQTTPQNSRVLGTKLTRRGLLVQNVSNQSVYVSIGNQAGYDPTTGVYADAIEVPPNSAYESPANAAPINDVYIVSEVAGAHVVIIESELRF